MDVGRMGVFADPTGAAISVWEAGIHKGAGIVNEPGAYAWSDLMATDLETALAFYPAVFGWEVAKNPSEGPPQYVEWQVAGRSIAGMMPKPPNIPAEVPAHWGVYFAVADTDAAVGEVTRLGGTVRLPPMDIEPGRLATVADPTGAVFNVMALKSGLGG
jgi:predicted enzyme related to lactoylglutathione lyase